MQQAVSKAAAFVLFKRQTRFHPNVISMSRHPTRNSFRSKQVASTGPVMQAVHPYCQHHRPSPKHLCEKAALRGSFSSWN